MKATTTETEFQDDRGSEYDEDDDEETGQTGDLTTPNEETLTEQTTTPNPEDSTETTPEEQTPPDNTNDEITLNNRDHIPLPPTEQTPDEKDLDPSDAENTPTNNKDDQGPPPPTQQTSKEQDDASNDPNTHKVKVCTVDVKTLPKPTALRIPSISTTPSTSLLPIAQNPPITPSPQQKAPNGIRHLELPLVRHMNSTYQYTEDDIKAYIIGAIRQEEITYCKKNDDIEVSSELSESILKGCKESSNEIPNPGKGSASKKKNR